MKKFCAQMTAVSAIHAKLESAQSHKMLCLKKMGNHPSFAQVFQ